MALMGEERREEARARRDEAARPLWWDAVLFLTVLAPFLVVALRWSRSDWFPIQDQAVLVMRLDDLLAGRPPLLGAFSRYEWSHPGPVWFYALAPFRALGQPSWVVAGSILWFGAGPATAAVLARRRYGPVVAGVTVCAITFALLGADPFSIVVPWNPHLAFAWLPVFLILCVGAAQRRVVDLAAAVLVGSALVQLHVGYVVLVALPVGAALTVLIVDGTLRGSPRQLISSLWTPGARRWWIAGAVIWVPPILEQALHGRDGNLWRLASFFVRGSDDAAPAGWGFAVRALGGAVADSSRVVGGQREGVERFTGWVVPGSPWWAAPLVLLLVVAGWTSIRSRWQPGIASVAVAAGSLAAALLALARLLGDRWPYLFVWRYQIMWFVIAVSLVAIVGSRADVRRRLSQPSAQRGASVVLGVLVVVCAALVLRMVLEWPTGRTLPAEPAVQELADELLRGEPPDAPTPLVRFGSLLVGVGDGVLRAAEDRGWDVGVPPSLGYKYGDRRVVDPSGSESTWLVTESSSDTTVAQLIDGARVRALVSPLDATEDAELFRLQATVLEAMVAAGRPDLHAAARSSLVGLVLDDHGIDVDDQVVERLSELNAELERPGRCRCAVIEVPAATPQHVEQALTTVVRFPTG